MSYVPDKFGDLVEGDLFEWEDKKYYHRGSNLALCLNTGITFLENYVFQPHEKVKILYTSKQKETGLPQYQKREPKAGAYVEPCIGEEAKE